jgi:hypothetical protein
VLQESVEALRVNDVDQVANLNPHNRVSESFSVNVSTHTRGELIFEIQLSLFENLVQPRDRDSMRPLQVTHGRIAASLNDPNHRLIVLMEVQNGLVR